MTIASLLLMPFVITSLSLNAMTIKGDTSDVALGRSGQEFSVVLEKKELNEGISTYLLDFHRFERALTDIVFEGSVLASDFVAPGAKLGEIFYEKAQEAFSQEVAVKVRRLVFVDYDGVAARMVVQRASDQREFPFVLDKQNWIIFPDHTHAWKTLKTDMLYGPAVRDAAQKIVEGQSILPSTQSEQAELIERAMSVLVKAIEREELALEFAYRYEPVNEDLAIFLQRQKEYGAEFFILSAKPFHERKSDFLLSQFGDIFAPSESNNFFERYGSALGLEFESRCSYIFSRNKDGTLANAMDIDRDAYLEIVFIDDQVNAVKQYKGRVEALLSDSSQKGRFLFIPYPGLSQAFNRERYLSDVLDLTMKLSPKATLLIQDTLFREK